MGLAVIHTRANVGVDAPEVTVEVHISNGLPAFTLVGLPETTVKEARDRVRSALINSEFEYPSKRITVNLAPADLPKGGSRFDLAIALGIIVASGQLKHVDLSKMEFVGELALSGALRKVAGIVPLSFAASIAKRTLFLPSDNVDEASLVQNSQLIAANSLLAVYAHLKGTNIIPLHQFKNKMKEVGYSIDFTDVVGQAHTKRALEIAAAGEHNILLFGPPGTGKSMLASRILTIMPDLTERQALESASIRSIAGEMINPATWKHRPFRQPHHSSSPVALVGGGASAKPGEISLAHNGVLFLDELPQYQRNVLDVLREPLETGKINISRAAVKLVYPCQFQLVAAMNPSPTGDVDDKRATSDQVLKYLNKLSGPFLDRIDLQVNVPKIAVDQLQHTSAHLGDTSDVIKARVITAQRLQISRQGVLNTQLNNAQLEKACQLGDEEHAFLLSAVSTLGLSMRGYHRTLRVARTIADLQNDDKVILAHLAEALGYRAFDRMLNELTDSP